MFGFERGYHRGYAEGYAAGLRMGKALGRSEEARKRFEKVMRKSAEVTEQAREAQERFDRYRLFHRGAGRE